MQNFKDLFISSYKELKQLRCITLMAMLGAVSIVIGFFLTFMPTESIKITFTFLPNELVFYLFGPVVGAIYGAALDILNYIVRPMGPFFPGFTISGILTGILYGVILYKKPVSLLRIIVANVLHLIIINLILNTFWLTMLYGNSFIALLPMRALKAIIMLPVETVLLFAVIKALEATGIFKVFHKNA